MIDIPFKNESGGLFKVIGPPAFGQQHQGIAPGGAMDCFSYQTGNALLGAELAAPALEIIFAPSFQVVRDCCFIITGARYDAISLSAANPQTATIEIEHAVVYAAKAGDLLEFKNKGKLGFRTYLCFVEPEKIKEPPVGKRRDQYGGLMQWADPEGKIRVVEGPEFKYLVDKNSFITDYWVITNDFSDMGFRLMTREEVPKVEMDNMISEAVADGTVQLTPKGPIVLLKHRQTVGGYPRIFNIISADVDILGQYAPNQVLQFKKVSIEDALAMAQEKQKTLNKLL
ncbi:MAG: hypothetical protein HQ517_16040 [SAR324 cluster bacterium]|nr:hypothetical protein [SAR324 cluster bacterium]